MGIKTIIFDLGNVIVDYSNQRLYENLAGCAELEWREVKDRIERSEITEEFDRGKFSGRKFYGKLSNLIGMEISYEDFKGVWSSHFSRKKEMEKLVKKLKNNYKLFLLSNINELHYGWLEENYPILKSFDEHVLSFKVGKRKPNPEIFEIALEKTGAKPKGCAYTDDIEKYVKVADNLGIRGIVFKNREQLAKEIKDLGVKLRGH